MNYKNIFIDHFRKYPAMLPNDFFKLIFQNSHGPHHINQNNIKTNFINELNSLTKPPKYNYEDIGNNYTRVYLNPLWTDNEKELVLNAFIKSNLDYNPNVSLLYEELSLLKELVKSKEIPLNFKLFEEELENYIYNGPKAISHSLLYKQEYDPHYVVINNLYLKDIQSIF